MSFVEKRNSILERLQTAMELELATIPPYMMGLLSIKPGANLAAAELIRGVMMEEMLHMVLVGNLIFSLGGRTRLGRANSPVFPLRMKFKNRDFSDRSFDIPLRGLSKEQLEIFLKIELPAGLVEAFGMITLTLEVPAPSIGHFYSELARDLRALAALAPIQEVFIGDPDLQVGPGYFWGAMGRPIVIRSLDEALAALELIIRQGEGAAIVTAAGEGQYFLDPKNHAHYFRFREILDGKRYKTTDTPLSAPSGESLVTDYSACFALQENPKSADYGADTALGRLNSSFNRQYSVMLAQIELAFNGHPDVLYEAITNGMHGMAGIAYEMVRTPVPGNTGLFGCPTFEWVDVLASSA